MSPPEAPTEPESRPVADNLSTKQEQDVEPNMVDPQEPIAKTSEAPQRGEEAEAEAMVKGQKNESLEGAGSSQTGAGVTAKAPDDQTSAAAETNTDTTQSERPSTPVDKGKQADRASAASPKSSSQFLAPESSASYVDPTPATPTTSQPPSRTPSNAARPHTSEEHSPTRSDTVDDEKRYTSEEEQEGGSRSEIQSIMEQFSETGGGPGAEEVMSPRLEITSPILGGPSPQHPPRKSSLEPLAPSFSGQLQNLTISTESLSNESSATQQKARQDGHAPPVPPKDGSVNSPTQTRDDRVPDVASPQSPQMSVHRPPPPEPEPEPPLPFDFHRFLEQLRNKKADPVARYLKSFLQEFAKKQWMVHEQVKIIGDFLAFIANKMMQCEVWRDVSDAEFDNAREGMEKLVMNRLYSQTFSPAIPAPKPIPGAKPKRKGGDTPLGPGRRGQHQEDVERDDILAQKINIYGWVREEHLDIPQIGDSGKRFLKLAQQGSSTHSTGSGRPFPTS